MLIEEAGGSTRLDRVSRKHLDTLVAAWRKRGLADRSIDTYTRHLKSALGKAVAWDIIKKSPLGDVKIQRRKPKLRPYIIPPERIEQFLVSIKDLAWRRIVALFCATGRRRQELLYLESDLVDMERRRYCVDRSKTDESEGWYPMTPAAVAAFEAFKPFPEGYLLPRMHPDTLSHRIKAYLSAAGYPRVSLHGLRVSFGARYLSAGGSLTVLQKLLGHADFGTTQDHYAALVPGYLEEEAARVNFAVDLKGTLRAIK
jgi:integrase/recombinase XerD